MAAAPPLWHYQGNNLNPALLSHPTTSRNGVGPDLAPPPLLCPKSPGGPERRSKWPVPREPIRLAPPLELPPDYTQLRHGLRVGALTVVLSLLSYWIISRFFVIAVIVQGASMLPTLHDGERLLLNRWIYHYRQPQRGDVVVIRDPGHCDYAVKRIVGMPLDSLDLKGGEVYVNGKQFDEPYLKEGTRTVAPDGKDRLILIGKDRYFVLGDNRPISEDSRYYGSVRRDQIVGVITD